MAYTDEQAAAIEQLDQAIHNACAVFKRFDDANAFISGWCLIVGAASFLKDHPELVEEDDDEEAMVSAYTCFNRRGQLPIVSRGLIEAYRDRYVRDE